MEQLIENPALHLALFGRICNPHGLRKGICNPEILNSKHYKCSHPMLSDYKSDRTTTIATRLHRIRRKLYSMISRK